MNNNTNKNKQNKEMEKGPPEQWGKFNSTV